MVDAKPQTDANTTPDAFVQPAAPTLGTQVDRLGRPAINTALNHTFDPDAARKQAAKDAYNAAANPATWATTALGTGDVVVTQFETNLGIIDSLDSSATVDGCSDGHHPPFYTAAADKTAYQTLAGALANDALLLNTASGTCAPAASPRQGYLAVEGAMATSTAPMSCGGRAPTYDVIDMSYTVLAAGIGPALSTTTWVSDGVDTKGTGAANNTDFPFLAAP
ncbi:MAG: DUF4331 family protein [Deltaproteobacteria bacterium]|nr:DUF4331 family protein [Deltaproteobacteria bacterium]